MTLTKAIFLSFCILALLAALCAAFTEPGTVARRRILAPVLAAAAVFGLLVGGWIIRNDAVSGTPRLTNSRSGIALSTRAVFDTMTPRQYAASLVFWTGSIGPRIAARWFGQATADSFDLRTPGGFYDVGQNGYGVKVAAVMRTDHLPFLQAAAIVDAQTVASIGRHKLGYAASMLPLTWRGLWVDEFLWLGIPCLFAASWRAWRRRDGIMGLVLSLGLFNMLAYAALSLNIERYQLTALPSTALAVATILVGRREA